MKIGDNMTKNGVSGSKTEMNPNRMLSTIFFEGPILYNHYNDKGFEKNFLILRKKRGFKMFHINKNKIFLEILV